MGNLYVTNWDQSSDKPIPVNSLDTSFNWYVISEKEIPCEEDSNYSPNAINEFKWSHILDDPIPDIEI